MIRRGVVALAIAGAVVGCNNGGTAPQRDDSVTQAINSSTDCAALQDMFDAYDEAHGLADALEDKERFTDYMQAADARMREVGCYE